jgi:hypothetical protein
VSFTDVWKSICDNAGEVVYTVTHLDFTYEIDSNQVRPLRTNQNIPRSSFEKAHDQWPMKSPAEMPDSVRGPSYVFAILADKRPAIQA